MGKKVLIFKGSARKNGYTQKMLDAVCEGIAEGGGEAVYYNLASREIIPCRGCEYCYTHPGCSIKDYLSPMYQQFEEGANFIMASPLYWASISGITKVWLDRMHPILDGVHWGLRWPNVKYATLYVSGNTEDDPNAEENVNLTERTIAGIGLKSLGSVWLKYTDRENFVIPEEMLEKARSLGRLLATE